MPGKKSKCNFDAIVFDIGSGASKSYRYHIDFCDHELNISIVDDKVIHIQYQECISNSEGTEIPKYCLAMGAKSVKAFRDYYNVDCTKNLCMGVATAWARNADNADNIIEFYKKQGIDIEIIDQVQEGTLSLEAAMKVIDEDLQTEALILDLGGGSHQISYYDKYENIEIYLGSLGNSNFYKGVVEKFTMEYLYEDVNSYFRADILPEVFEYAHEMVGEKAKEQISIEFSVMYGLGRSIYNYMVDNLELGPEVVTKAELKDMIYLLSTLTQAEAVEKFNLTATSFAPYMQSSLIIIYSLLDALGLEELNLLPVRMTDTVLLEYLKDRKLRKSYYD